MPPNVPPLLILSSPVMPLPILHSLGPSILDSSASYHLSGNKDFFSSLTITSPLLTITLANGTQTMAKGIESARPLPSLPLTYVLHVPDSPFNLISISKLIHDINCSITFSHSSVTLHDWSTGRTIGIDMSLKAFIISFRPHLPLFALKHMNLFSSIVVSIIRTFPSFKR